MADFVEAVDEDAVEAGELAHLARGRLADGGDLAFAAGAVHEAPDARVERVERARVLRGGRLDLEQQALGAGVAGELQRASAGGEASG